MTEQSKSEYAADEMKKFGDELESYIDARPVRGQRDRDEQAAYRDVLAGIRRREVELRSN